MAPQGAQHRTSWYRHALHRRPGEYRMRLVMLGVIVGCLCLDPIGSVKAASWTSAKFPGEQNRAVQGCGDNVQNVGDWLCLVVRCDHPGSLGLHLQAVCGAIGRSAAPLNTRCNRAARSYRCNEVGPHDRDSWFPAPAALQSDFTGELANGHRKSRGSMCIPVWRRLGLLAAHGQENRCLLIIGSRQVGRISHKRVYARLRRAMA